MSEKRYEARKPRRFEREFKMSAVERMKAGESPTALARELGVRRKLLYDWKKRIEEGGPQSVHEDGLPGPVPGGYAKPEVNDERILQRIRALDAEGTLTEASAQKSADAPEAIALALATARPRDGWAGTIIEYTHTSRERGEPIFVESIGLAGVVF